MDDREFGDDDQALLEKEELRYERELDLLGKMQVRISGIVTVLTAAVVIGLATGFFEFELGSFLIWGFILGVAMAVASRLHPFWEMVGRAWGLVLTVALIVFLIKTIF